MSVVMGLGRIHWRLRWCVLMRPSFLQSTPFPFFCFVYVRDTSPSDLLPSVYLCTNSIRPTYMGVAMGLGPRTLAAVVCVFCSLFCSHVFAGRPHPSKSRYPKSIPSR